eukprot:XP_011412406.1 PREDICTED: uncharacterized protein LOC105317464 [Crassostrea gigas]
MAGGCVLTLFHLIMLHQSLSLPQWVYRVNSCPDPKNISQWIEASKRLNCYHNLTSSSPTEQERIYHCLPSSFLNETVEFCSRSVPIESGNCPVYSYEFGTSTTPISYNCTDFISGCPTAMFKSKEIYKFPKCLKLNRKLRCFKAERNCTSVLVTVISNRETNAEKLVSVFISIFSTLAVVGIFLYIHRRFNLHCQKSRTCHDMTRCQSICWSTLDMFEKDPLMSSNELTSDEKLSFSVLQQSFNPKLNNSRNVSCKEDQINDLKCIEKMTSNGVRMKDDRRESSSSHSSLHTTRHNKIRHLESIIIYQHRTLTSKFTIVMLLIKVIENNGYKRDKPKHCSTKCYSLEKKYKKVLHTKSEERISHRKIWLADCFYNLQLFQKLLHKRRTDFLDPPVEWIQQNKNFTSCLLPIRPLFHPKYE